MEISGKFSNIGGILPWTQQLGQAIKKSDRKVRWRWLIIHCSRMSYIKIIYWRGLTYQLISSVVSILFQHQFNKITTAVFWYIYSLFTFTLYITMLSIHPSTRNLFACFSTSISLTVHNSLIELVRRNLNTYNNPSPHLIRYYTHFTQRFGWRKKFLRKLWTSAIKRDNSRTPKYNLILKKIL